MMDVSEAEKAPGVVAIYTPFNSLKLYHGLTQAEGANSGEIDPPLQNNKVRYYGQIIGLIVAESFEQGRDAAALVKVDYTPEQPVTTWEAGLKYAFPALTARTAFTRSVSGESFNRYPRAPAFKAGRT